MSGAAAGEVIAGIASATNTPTTDAL